LHIQTERKLEAISSSVVTFDSRLGQRKRDGLITCWGIYGSLVSWEPYEQELMATKCILDTSLEKTVVLKGKPIVKFLSRDFQLL